MILGYITRGTTIHGKPVNAGQVASMDSETFAKLKMLKDVREATEQDAKARETVEPKKGKTIC